MNRRAYLIALFAVMLVLGVSVGHAWAYFTDSTTAQGGLALSLKPTTSMTEDNQPQSKVIRVQNTSDVVSVWARVRAFAPEELNLSAEGSKWVQDGDWYVYTDVVPAGKETDELVVRFDLTKAFSSTGGPQDGDEVNVIVVYEAETVSYGADGKPAPASWKA